MSDSAAAVLSFNAIRPRTREDLTLGRSGVLVAGPAVRNTRRLAGVLLTVTAVGFALIKTEALPLGQFNLMIGVGSAAAFLGAMVMTTKVMWGRLYVPMNMLIEVLHRHAPNQQSTSVDFSYDYDVHTPTALAAISRLWETHRTVLTGTFLPVLHDAIIRVCSTSREDMTIFLESSRVHGGHALTSAVMKTLNDGILARHPDVKLMFEQVGAVYLDLYEAEYRTHLNPGKYPAPVTGHTAAPDLMYPLEPVPEPLVPHLPSRTQDVRTRP